MVNIVFSYYSFNLGKSQQRKHGLVLLNAYYCIDFGIHAVCINNTRSI